MPEVAPRAVGSLARLARPSGTFAMVALDQRESLRTMLHESSASGSAVADEALSAFKIEAARALTPYASAVLLDVEYGLEPVRRADGIAAGCGLIVAADRLDQKPGGPVESTDVDVAVLSDPQIGPIADAFKLLVIWRPDRGRGDRERVVRTFLDACRRAGRPGIVEGIVRVDDRPSADEHARLVTAAAIELGSAGPDLYKAEVPTLGRGANTEIATAAQRLTEVLACPWVVLSNGVEPDRFADAAVAACRGGASGFLAGRALWLPSVSARDRAAHLRGTAAPRLQELARRVDEAARPWTAAPGGA